MLHRTLRGRSSSPSAASKRSLTRRSSQESLTSKPKVERRSCQQAVLHSRSCLTVILIGAAPNLSVLCVSSPAAAIILEITNGTIVLIEILIRPPDYIRGFHSLNFLEIGTQELVTPRGAGNAVLISKGLVLTQQYGLLQRLLVGQDQIGFYLALCLLHLRIRYGNTFQPV